MVGGDCPSTIFKGDINMENKKLIEILEEKRESLFQLLSTAKEDIKNTEKIMSQAKKELNEKEILEKNLLDEITIIDNEIKNRKSTLVSSKNTITSPSSLREPKPSTKEIIAEILSELEKKYKLDK